MVTDYGQSVKACLLGQSAASVMGREVIGSSAEELRAVGAAMRKMLKAGRAAACRQMGRPRHARAGARLSSARHASTLLVFDAVEDALAQIEANRAAVAGAGLHSEEHV